MPRKGSHRRADHPRVARGRRRQEGRPTFAASWEYRSRHSTAGSGGMPGLGLSELRELRQLREENRKLKTLVADLTLDKHILQEVLSKKA